MAIIEQHQLLENLKEGIKKAQFLSESVLVSYSKQIEFIDPLVFYRNGEILYKGSRIYWSDVEDVTMVGLGSAVVQAYNGEERFEKIEEYWRKVITGAVIHREVDVKGTGPVCMGGFSFDPVQMKTRLWKDFPDANFTVPNWLLTVKGNQCFLSINASVNEHMDPCTIESQLIDLEMQLLKNNTIPTPSQGESLMVEENQINEWLAMVHKSIDAINKGEMEKVVLSRTTTVTANKTFDQSSVLLALQERQSDCYTFAFEKGTSTFVGSTPERLIKKAGGKFNTMCLAGTISRGQTAEEDQKLGETLLSDPKNRDEHQMVVTMISDAMGKVCDKIVKSDSPQIYKSKDVQHLYTPIKGETKRELSLLSVVKALHPTPAMGGVPTEKAIEAIRERETYERGWYSAPIGWFDEDGDGEFVVAIRSGLITKENAVLFSGCGIVADSDPQSEYLETKIKFTPMLTALGGGWE
ncbi:isochorismate synthase [Scopulibacillus darangshiensis]|uniref:Isochorismate synthase MenF n=1 Tax=Scopulibacillus darangshiensis TaxID=442528 RepID=A0A4R2P501_9BACL|nr:isochorismate synthase [Scopulibacillus darangshiensis]TCP29842.1 isochorismate synthase [Scopulibacillus darangshiensis]